MYACDYKSFLTNDNVQSWSNRVNHSHCGVTHTVCRACNRHNTWMCAATTPDLTPSVCEYQCQYLQGWCQYAADKAAKWQQDRSHKGRPLVVSAQSNRGAIRWTCRPHPHTPRCYKQTQELLLGRHLPASLAVIVLSYHSVCTLTALTRQSLPGLSSGGGLWPGSPALSLNNN